VTECIHGLELETCDSCRPRTPEEPRPASTGPGRAVGSRAGRAVGPAPAGRTTGTRAGTSRASATPGGASLRSTAVGSARAAAARGYLIVPVGEALPPFDADTAWSALTPSVLPPEVAVVVASAAAPDGGARLVQFVAVANEPARRQMRDAGITERLVVQPGWFVAR